MGKNVVFYLLLSQLLNAGEGWRHSSRDRKGNKYRFINNINKINTDK